MAGAAVACVVVTGVALMLTNSRLGATVLLDCFGDDDSGLTADPETGPLKLSDSYLGSEEMPATAVVDTLAARWELPCGNAQPADAKRTATAQSRADAVAAGDAARTGRSRCRSVS